MIAAQVPENDLERVQTVREYDQLSDEDKADLQSLANLASEICETPIALVTFITKEEQLIKVSRGYDAKDTTREAAFCAHTILNSEVFEVENAKEDERFHDNPFVTEEPNVRFYAGTPLAAENGHHLGALCVLDREPRKLSTAQKNALNILSAQVMKRLELSRAKRELERQNDQLRKVTQLRTRLLNVLAHDVRSPLASIRAVMDLIADGDLSQAEILEFQGNVELVLDQTERLLENVLDWGASASADIRESESVDVAKMVQEVVELSTIQANLKKVNLICHFEIDGERRIQKDIFRLTLRNILANAIKFSVNSEVWVALTDLENSVMLTVTDHGSGMTEAKRDKILLGEIQSSSLGTMGEKGSGLGMSFVTEMLYKIGATLSIDINEDGGSTFKVIFPTS